MKRFSSYAHYLYTYSWRILLALIAVLGLTAGPLGVSSSSAQVASSLPCDIYASYGTPCVAAHSTVRALFASYKGPLYRVQRMSDKTYLSVGLLSVGGYANAAAQVSFCLGTTCTITKIYDQTANHNDLPISGGGYFKGPGPNGSDLGADAMALPVTVAGHQVFGIKVTPGVGYRNNSTLGVAKNGAPEEMYMVTSGTYVNSGCCFDYGNAETSGGDTGNGHMDAVNFGTECWFSPCSKPGPWVQADLENGLFAGGDGSNINNKGNSSMFVTALLKNNGQDRYAIKGGNAQSGSLTTWYDGPESNRRGYSPMHQEGAIILGTGGDNSHGGRGIFFEGAMTAGYPSDAADDAVQASIVSAGYSSSASSTPTPTPKETTNVNGLNISGGSSASSTPTPTPTTSPGGPSCKVTYTVIGQWPGGFDASMIITNTGSTAWSNWTLKFSFANSQKIVLPWNANASQSVGSVTMTNAFYNGSVAPGASVSSGFIGFWNGTDLAPKSFTVNGMTCF